MSDPISPYERPIRPLPKRRLRERLSPELADTIQCPPVPQTAPPLFYHPYTIREEVVVPVKVVESQHPSNRERGDEVEPRGYISRRIGEDAESDEDEIAYRSRVYSRHTADTTGRSYRYVQKLDTKHPKPQGPASAASSADGYDSFENTNNKKKRKIPTPGENGVHVANETGALGVSSVDEPADDAQAGVTYHSSTIAGSHGLSGPGRGRYGRNRSGRSPLRTLSDSSGNWGNSRTTKQRLPQWSTPTESPGIISRSIANANAEKSPIQPARGQENISLLQQQASKKASPSTQFTFTCDSQVPGTVPWPASTTTYQNPPSTRVNTQATQTSPNMAGGTQSYLPNGHKSQKNGGSQNIPNGQKQASAGRTKKTRRHTGNEYLKAARKRRQEQQARNAEHPTAKEDDWVCEFCEYERIFGTPPEALIRQYEIKDKKIKKQEKERRRLLLKAKSKGRKGKKGSKAAPKAAASTHDRQPQHQTQQTSMNQSQSQGTQSEEYYDDEYDEDYDQDEPPPPSPVAPVHQQNALRPDPGKHIATQGGSVHLGGGGGHARNVT